MNGVAMTTSSEVEKFAHTSSGMRQNDMPGARIVMIVTRKLSAVAIEDAPANCTPIVKNICPIGTHDHRQQAADEHEEERRHDVLDADHLVVGVDAAVVAPRVGAVPRVV